MPNLTRTKWERSTQERGKAKDGGGKREEKGSERKETKEAWTEGKRTMANEGANKG
jgi:hypothetical protein